MFQKVLTVALLGAALATAACNTVRGAAKDNFKFSSIVLGIVNTDAFRKQGVAPVSKTGEAKSGAAN